MTSEQAGLGPKSTGPSGGVSPATAKTPEIQRARAELVEALTEFEDRINLPKRFKRFSQEKPGTVRAALGGAGALVAGIVTLVIVGATRRK